MEQGDLPYFQVYPIGGGSTNLIFETVLSQTYPIKQYHPLLGRTYLSTAWKDALA